MTEEPLNPTRLAAPPIPLGSSAQQRRPGPVVDITTFPYTHEEWVKVMEEVKRFYVKRQYKQCSARCIQILENIKDPYRVHPLHSIYLSFYAASSLELTARSLHINSSKKLPLLQQALSCYKYAESRIEYAEFSADPNIVQAARQRSTSIVSSIRSSVESLFSQIPPAGSNPSSALPSPTTSFCASRPEKELTQPITTSNERITSGPLRVKKKVSFNPNLPTVVSEAGLSSIPDSHLIDSFPAPPRSPTPSPEPETDISFFLLSRSLIRYRSHLSVLHIQFAYHIGSINAQVHTLQTTRKARRSNLPNLFTTDFGAGAMDGVDKAEMKKVELKARIERLKAAGWRRERFGGERYQMLAEKALAELESE